MSNGQIKRIERWKDEKTDWYAVLYELNRKMGIPLNDISKIRIQFCLEKKWIATYQEKKQKGKGHIQR